MHHRALWFLIEDDADCPKSAVPFRSRDAAEKHAREIAQRNAYASVIVYEARAVTSVSTEVLVTRHEQT